MALVIHCPTCRHPLAVLEAQAGTVVACPTCRHPLTVPPVADAVVHAVQPEPEPAFVPSRRRPQKRGGAGLLLAGVAVGIVAAAGVWFAVRAPQRSETPVAADPVPQAKADPAPRVAVQPVRAEPAPKRVDLPKKAEPVAANAEWERKSRAKLAEGLELLRDPKTWGDARIALYYAFADAVDADMTAEQLEMMLEISVRLATIHLVEKDKQQAYNMTGHITYYRKRRGWDKDTFDAWAGPVVADTSKRMGVK